MKYNFKSDYLELCNDEIIDELVKIKEFQRDGYQDDDYTNEIKNSFKTYFKENVDLHFMTGGTIANLTFIAHCLKSYEAVISPTSGHIAVHETGAIELTGHKIILAETINGKINSDSILKVLSEHSSCHMVVPKLVFISNSTEYGTIYTKEELVNLYKTCKENSLYLYLDGARLHSALEAEGNNLTLEDVCTYTDAFYIGGTKNGAMLGELMVIKNENLKSHFKFQIKSRGGLLAKGSLIAAQFKVLFTNNLINENAKNANRKATIIREAFIENGYELLYPNNTNQIFVKVSKKFYSDIIKNFDVMNFTETKEYVIIRIVTSFATTDKAVEELVSYINDKK